MYKGRSEKHFCENAPCLKMIIITIKLYTKSWEPAGSYEAIRGGLKERKKNTKALILRLPDIQEFSLFLSLSVLE